MATAPKKASEFERLAADELDDLTVIVPVVTETEDGETADAAMELPELAAAVRAEAPVQWGEVEGKPETFPPASHTHAYDTLTGKPTLGTAAAENVGAFAAASHEQAMSTIIGLVAALAAKLDGAMVGAPNGAASLDGDGKILASQISAIAITEPFECADQAAMLALGAQKGDVAIRLDLNKCFMLATNTPGTLADWKELRTPTDVVLAVAGLAGTISAAALKAALALEIDDVAGLQDALDGAGGGGGFETLVSGATVTLDFAANEMAQLVVAHNVTFAFSNLAAGKRKEVILSAGSTFTLAYPAGIKNVGGTALPASIGATDNITLRFSSAGTTDAEVRVEFVNGAGVAVSLTPAPAQECHKAGSVGFNLGSSVAGGPNLGWLTVTLSASAGTFSCGNGNGLISETLDAETGRNTAKQFLSTRDNLASALTSFTWYPPTSSGIPVVGAGSITMTISDVFNSPFWNIAVTAYGADEVQQLDWLNTGSPYTPAAGTFTLTTVAGATGAIAASGGASAMQAALTTLMGADAPNVTGGGSTYSFTWSNGDYAHTDVAEITVTEVTTIHDGSNTNWGAPMRATTGDGVSISDSFTGSWDTAGVGTVDWGSGPIAKGGGSFSIGPVTYNVVDSGLSYTVTCTDLDPHADISATPNYGLPLTATMSTPTPGNT